MAQKKDRKVLDRSRKKDRKVLDKSRKFVKITRRVVYMAKTKARQSTRQVK